MLLKENRLTQKKDFDKIFKEGKSFFSGIIGIKSTSNEFDFSRFGIIVSNKISKKAVTRNKIRRQIREIIRLNLENIKKGMDIAIICNQGIEKKTYKEIEREILQILERIKLL